MVGHQLAVDDIRQSTLQAAQRLFGGLALGPFAFVVGAAFAFGVADLGHRHDVQGVVDPAVARARQAVAYLVAGRDVQRGGAVIGGEVVLGREAAHVPHLGQHPAGDERPHAVQVDQARLGGLDHGGDAVPGRTIPPWVPSTEGVAPTDSTRGAA
jgi:hypothetical protein